MDSAEPERIGQDVLVERTSETTPIWTPGSISSALQSPIRQISENAGVGGSIVVGRVMNERSGSFGYNAQSNDYCDMIEHGIIDPAKVVRVALQDAASIAGLMIATEAGVAALQADLHPEGAAHALLPAWGPHSDRSSPLTIDGREGGNQHA